MRLSAVEFDLIVCLCNQPVATLLRFCATNEQTNENYEAHPEPFFFFFQRDSDQASRQKYLNDTWLLERTVPIPRQFHLSPALVALLLIWHYCFPIAKPVDSRPNGLFPH